MEKVYLVLLTIAGAILLYDAFHPAVRDRTRGTAVRLLPLALFFWLLVVWLQVADRVF